MLGNDSRGLSVKARGVYRFSIVSQLAIFKFRFACGARKLAIRGSVSRDSKLEYARPGLLVSQPNVRLVNIAD